MRQTIVALALGLSMACTGSGGTGVASSPAAAKDVGLVRQTSSSCSYTGTAQPVPETASTLKLADLTTSGFNVHLFHFERGYQYPDWAAGFLVSHATLVEHASRVADATVKPGSTSSLTIKFYSGTYGILCVPLNDKGSEYGVGYTAGPIVTADLPLPRGYHLMADAAGSGVVMFAGWTASPPHGGVALSELWKYSHAAAPNWHREATLQPSTDGDNLICLDDCSRVLWLGAEGADGHAWVLDIKTGQWRKKSAPAHVLFAMRAAYDSESKRVIAFGGARAVSHPLDETWAYDPATDTWTQMHPKSSPPARYWHAMVYDVSADRVVVFGGLGDQDVVHLNDTWTYDFNRDTWSQVQTSSAPPGRLYHALAYDAGAKRTVLFGGMDANGQPLPDTWFLDTQGTKWTEIGTPGPSARAWHAMAYDADQGVVVLFGGGETRDRYLNDVWLFSASTATWSKG